MLFLQSSVTTSEAVVPAVCNAAYAISNVFGKTSSPFFGVREFDIFASHIKMRNEKK